MKSRLSLLVAAFIFLTATSHPGATSAYSTILTQWGGWGGADFGHGGVGYAGGSIWPNPNYTDTSPAAPETQVGVGLGGDRFLTSDTSFDFSASGSFNTWCVDITHWLIGGPVIYAVGGPSELAADFSAQRVGDLSKLANEDYSKITDQNGSAAFQLAVWAILFGTPNNGAYNLNNATFVAPASDPGAALAQSWLDQLNSAPVTGNYNITYLFQPYPLADNTQDLVVFTDPPSAVPEPGTLLLLALGLLLLGFSWYRHRQA